MKATLVVLLTCITAAPVQAQEIVGGVGYTHFNRNVAENGAVLELEYHFAPSWKIGSGDVYFALAGMVDDPGDYFIGAGLGMEFPLGNAGWFTQVSVMPGYYNASDANNDLGDDLEFRSSLAIGYRFQSGWSVSAAATHMSNAGIGDHNPGVAMATLRIGHSF